jgi:hypothetical protein
MWWKRVKIAVQSLCHQVFYTPIDGFRQRKVTNTMAYTMHAIIARSFGYTIKKIREEKLHFLLLEMFIQQKKQQQPIAIIRNGKTIENWFKVCE